MFIRLDVPSILTLWGQMSIWGHIGVITRPVKRSFSQKCYNSHQMSTWIAIRFIHVDQLEDPLEIYGGRNVNLGVICDHWGQKGRFLLKCNTRACKHELDACEKWRWNQRCEHVDLSTDIQLKIVHGRIIFFRKTTIKRPSKVKKQEESNLRLCSEIMFT